MSVIEKLLDAIEKLKVKKALFYFENGDFVEINNININKFKNTVLFNVVKEIDINSKNQKAFLKHYKLNKEEIKEFFKYIKNGQQKNTVILKNGTILNFNITNHAKTQFIKRFIIFIEIYNEYKNNMSKKLVEYYKTIINKIEKNENIDKDIDNIIIELLSDSKIFNPYKTIYRKTDIIHMSKRIKKYGKTHRYFNHPFVFIMNDSRDTLVTVELYSSNFPNLNIINSMVHKNKSKIEGFYKNEKEIIIKKVINMNKE